jgi:chromosomal replication initiator protein
VGWNVEKHSSWDRILEHLRSRIDEREFDNWFRDSRQRFESSDSIHVLVRTPLFIDYISKNYAQQLSEAARAAGLGTREIRFGTADEPSPTVNPRDFPTEPKRRGAGLNPAYKFDTFVTGESNRLAHAAALRVADQGTRQYNPLFVCGSSGLGKTHLMQAIGHRRLSRSPGDKVLYLPCEAFINEVIVGIRFNKMDSVRQKYRNADLLLVDDVAIIAGKEASETELFHTFNALYDEGKQIVFSSDKLPREIPNLTDRLKTRFEGGLLVDIQAPEFETRVAILRRKAEDHGLPLDDETAFFLAGKFKSSIRELEGHFNRVVALCELRGDPVSRELAEEALKDVLRAEETAATPAEVIKAVATHFGLKPAELRARTKREQIVFPRQVAMYILKEASGLSLPEIGRQFGDKHHTTALHAVRKIAQMREDDRDFDRLISGFVAQFR